MLGSNNCKILAQSDSVVFIWRKLGWNVPVGAGVIDCPIHIFARKQTPTSSFINDITEYDTEYVRMKMKMNVSVTLEQ